MSPRGAYKAAESKKIAAKTLGARIRLVRSQWGWPQADLAKVLGVPQQSVSSWERDKTEPLGPSMANLCRLLRMTEAELRPPSAFRVPDPPEPHLLVLHCPQRPQGSQDMLLPEPPPDQVVHITVEDGNALPLSGDEAVKVFRKALKAGQQVWLIVKKP